MIKKRTPKKSLKKEVYQIIRNDIPLRHQIATALNIESNSVYVAAVRKSPKLSLPFIVDLIAKSTGKMKHEILES
ncbi:hypothetical protein [Flavobacterium crassostreae]|uniref:Uncharacterized protein n=1 Tax=Flavobacterium crassostreae TaxID=1763534 RepID=A0A1B9E7T4_9FLAO|nr:hypothetical protein [Flavobacterium crassostreae]OCB78002.1 hypothetical protein LPBF_03370 [Flavobacterium crassostreae]